MTTAATQLRLAVAMNGGVSLAVWIGGVAAELDCFRRGEDGGWGDLMSRSGFADARIDVLAGTSAGGLNAVFLALAQAYEEVDLGVLREMWLDLADLDGALLRSPSASERISVLDGTYFYDQLRTAIDGLVAGKAPSENPVDLLITATMLHGEADDVLDDFGDVFVNNRYETGFRFRRLLEAGLDDDFCPTHDAAGQRLVSQLATASRATASFPVAFEPWFCDVGDERLFAPGERHRVELARSRFLVDGGVLNNLPVDRSIEAIFELPAEGLVERVLLAVIPLHQRPGIGSDDPRRRADPATPVPAPAAVAVRSGVTIPRDETDAQALRAIARNNQKVAARRRA